MCSSYKFICCSKFQTQRSILRPKSCIRVMYVYYAIIVFRNLLRFYVARWQLKLKKVSHRSFVCQLCYIGIVFWQVGVGTSYVLGVVEACFLEPIKTSPIAVPLPAVAAWLTPARLLDPQKQLIRPRVRSKLPCGISFLAAAAPVSCRGWQMHVPTGK